MFTLKLESDGKISVKAHYLYRNRCASIPGAKFDYKKKAWIVPKTSLKYIQMNCKGEIYYQTPQWVLEGKPEPPKKEIEFFNELVTIPELNLKPYDYQKLGMQFCIDRLEKIGFAMIGDGVGLGKTIEATGVIKYYKKPGDKILVVCKKSIKSQWVSEIKKFTGWEDVYFTGSTPKKRQQAYDDVKNGGILVTNYHNFLNDTDLIKEIGFSLCIIDEAHCIKGRTSKMNKNIGEVAQGTKTILLTGTPIMSKPDDIWGIVNMAAPGYLGSYASFRNKYLVIDDGIFGVQIVGAKNLDDLQAIIGTFLIKRSAEDVKLELPEVPDPIVIKVEMDAVQKKMNGRIEIEREHLNEVKRTILSNNAPSENVRKQIEEINEESKQYLAAMQFVADDPKLMKGRKGTVGNMLQNLIPKNYAFSPKTEATLDLIEEIVDSEEKVLVFCHLASSAQRLHDLLKEKGYESAMFTGGESDEVRAKSIEDFRNDINILIGTEACAEGLNLQFARCIIHYEQADTYAQREQRNGRLKRIGSKYKSIVIYDILTEESFDEVKYEKLKKDKNTIGALVGL